MTVCYNTLIKNFYISMSCRSRTDRFRNVKYLFAKIDTTTLPTACEPFTNVLCVTVLCVTLLCVTVRAQLLTWIATHMQCREEHASTRFDLKRKTPPTQSEPGPEVTEDQVHIVVICRDMHLPHVMS